MKNYSDKYFSINYNRHWWKHLEPKSWGNRVSNLWWVTSPWATQSSMRNLDCWMIIQTPYVQMSSKGKK
jgi:hypothetical protein